MGIVGLHRGAEPEVTSFPVANTINYAAGVAFRIM